MAKWDGVNNNFEHARIRISFLFPFNILRAGANTETQKEGGTTEEGGEYLKKKYSFCETHNEMSKKRGGGEGPPLPLYAYDCGNVGGYARKTDIGMEKKRKILDNGA